MTKASGSEPPPPRLGARRETPARRAWPGRTAGRRERRPGRSRTPRAPRARWPARCSGERARGRADRGGLPGARRGEAPRAPQRPETKTLPSPARLRARCQASRSSDFPPVSARNGFGLPSVDRGHSRVPLPPARMRARISAGARHSPDCTGPKVSAIGLRDRRASDAQGSTVVRKTGLPPSTRIMTALFTGSPDARGERHLSGDAIEVADLRQGLPDRLAVQPRAAPASAFARSLKESYVSAATSSGVCRYLFL